jgi:hypothetical protein
MEPPRGAQAAGVGYASPPQVAARARPEAAVEAPRGPAVLEPRDGARAGYASPAAETGA